MKWQSLFSGKNKKNIISLMSAKFAKRVVKVKENGCTFRGDKCQNYIMKRGLL